MQENATPSPFASREDRFESWFGSWKAPIVIALTVGWFALAVWIGLGAHWYLGAFACAGYLFGTVCSELAPRHHGEIRGD